MVDSPINTTLWIQGWMSAQELGMVEDMAQAWDNFQ